MRSKTFLVFLLALATGGTVPLGSWPAPLAWADSDSDPAEGSAGPDAPGTGEDAGPGGGWDDDGPDAAPEFDAPDAWGTPPPQPFGAPGGFPPGAGFGGLPPLPLMPGYPGGSPFDAGGQPAPPLPLMPGYPGGSPFDAGGASPEFGPPPQ